ncbi:MAG: asparaginase [bacterium]
MTEIVGRVIRNEREESVHAGHLAVIDARDNLAAFVGNADHESYIRSAAKPIQIMPMLQDGVYEHFRLTDRELAVIMASHNGEDFHIETVGSILKKCGLTENDLRCGFHTPMHQLSSLEHFRQNKKPSPIYNNCSGKHAGMLALAKFHGWELASYLDPEHPVQKRILQQISLFSNLAVGDIGIGVDGCSAPVFFMPLRNMARMYAQLARTETPLTKKVFDAMSTFPEMIAGSDRFDTVLMQVMNGRMISKVGAEGIRCLAVRGEKPFGIALKIADGSKRASDAVMLECLRQMDLISSTELQALSAYHKPTIQNWAGIETGGIQVEFELVKCRN